MRCPVCRADNTEGPNCRRCRADLSLLFALEEQRTALLDQARQQALSQHWSEAARLAEQAHQLRRDEDSSRLAAAAYVLQGDYFRAFAFIGKPRQSCQTP
jgi:hypothetical protein